ncbi:hypothetical protein K438DRAFT_1967940 [Mycena galopus ATCC 62051]|nr:hypothetical protein K438DRAFT_1967940 [Mycena galopus ATCC 62051]
MQQDGGFEKLWKKPLFTSRLISVVWDKAHCVNKWAGFHPEYKEAGRLRFLILQSISFVIVSATLPPASNGYPNIYFTVREMKYSMSSFKDLAFLINENWMPSDLPPPKFLIFFDSIADSIEAAKFLRARLPLAYQHKIKWFNSQMSPEFKDLESDGLKTGNGLDLPDILLVIQWQSTCNMCTLWQRLGRAARALHLTAMGLFLVEPKRFNTNIAKAEARATKRAEAGKKIKRLSNAEEQPAAKRAAVSSHEALDVPLPAPISSTPTPELPGETMDAAHAHPETTDPDDVPDVPLDVDALPQLPTISLEEYHAERCAVYDAVVAHEPTWKKQTKKGQIMSSWLLMTLSMCPQGSLGIRATHCPIPLPPAPTPDPHFLGFHPRPLEELMATARSSFMDKIVQWVIVGEVHEMRIESVLLFMSTVFS